ncbi:hypothetical protein AVEN_56077-1, partial [Araneus ventricosus]
AYSIHFTTRRSSVPNVPQRKYTRKSREDFSRTQGEEAQNAYSIHFTTRRSSVPNVPQRKYTRKSREDFSRTQGE